MSGIERRHKGGNISFDLLLNSIQCSGKPAFKYIKMAINTTQITTG